MKKNIVLILIAFVVFIAGCSKDETTTPNGSKTREENGVYPLTGLEAIENVDHRPVSVMVNNHPDARPQTGLSQADIVFEMLAEGSITRFLAIFQSEQPKEVGPVRSARQYYFELAEGYDALYLYHGSAKKVEKILQASDVESINGAFYDNDKKLFKREDFRVAPHNSYLLFDAVYDEAEKKGYDIEREQEALMFLEDDDVIEGDSAENVQINYASSGRPVVDFTYNATNDTYLRYNDNEQTVELADETPIEVENVFIVETDHEVIDAEGRRAIDMESGGQAMLIQKGKVQTVEWTNSNGRIVPVKDGEEIGLVKGKTWINVIPTSYGLSEAVTITNE